MSDFKGLIEKYSSQVKLATFNDKVYKDECVFSYTTPFSADGLLVCLNRFIGISQEFLPIYFAKTQSHLYLRIKSIRKEVSDLKKYNLNSYGITRAIQSIGYSIMLALISF